VAHQCTCSRACSPTAFRKLRIVIEICLAHNVFLKLSKSWFGRDHAIFFGYRVGKDYYCRLLRLLRLLRQFPDLVRSSKCSVSWVALFFPRFHPAFLQDMTRKEFVWDSTAWTTERIAAFDEFKAALHRHFVIYYPDYSLPWVVRCDASTVGAAEVLHQIKPATDTEPEQLPPLALVSTKFSPQAQRWKTLEQEAYAIYFTIHALESLLLGKPFVLETDHANLLFMDKSLSPKVIRYCIYLQQFTFLVRHILGKLNLVADCFSRIHDAPYAGEGGGVGHDLFHSLMCYCYRSRLCST